MDLTLLKWYRQSIGIVLVSFALNQDFTSGKYQNFLIPDIFRIIKKYRLGIEILGFTSAAKAQTTTKFKNFGRNNRHVIFF